jgi:hypothetical protein
MRQGGADTGRVCVVRTPVRRTACITVFDTVCVRVMWRRFLALRFVADTSGCAERAGDYLRARAGLSVSACAGQGPGSAGRLGSFAIWRGHVYVRV